ncbi:MAG: hypothetical protein ACREQL_15810 [Candidatus Binatia bacterium]
MRGLLTASILLLASRGPVAANVLGGGLADVDCTVGFEDVTATNGTSGVVCTDGDPTCDTDAVAEGTCRFAVRVCARLAEDGCTPRDVSTIKVAGLSLDVPVAASGMRCGAVDTIVVPTGTTAGATLLAREGPDLKDVDYLNLCCRTMVAPFDAVRCALAIDPAVAGCAEPVPSKFVAALLKARALVDQAAADAVFATPAVKHAAKALRRMKTIARKLAKSNQCGDALGLLTTHAQQMLRAAHPSPT